MRLVFDKNKQKELIEKEKSKFNLSLTQLAKKLKINIGKLNGFYYDNILLSENIFNKFSLKDEYSRFVNERKDENWGRAKGGKNSSSGLVKKIKIPKKSKELAEFYGIMLGDGNLMMKKDYKIGTYQIRIVGDSRYGKSYLLNYVKPLIEYLFSIKVAVFKQKNTNALYLTCTGKKLAEFLEDIGFKAGDKIRNRLTIPDWIKNNQNFLRACLRGLYDTDGSAYKLTNQNVYQFSFRNYNSDLINNVRNSLLLLGISCSKISKGNEITITKKSELRKFLNIIGFSNSKHLDKVKMWNLAS